MRQLTAEDEQLFCDPSVHQCSCCYYRTSQVLNGHRSTGWWWNEQIGKWAYHFEIIDGEDQTTQGPEEPHCPCCYHSMSKRIEDWTEQFGTFTPGWYVPKGVPSDMGWEWWHGDAPHASPHLHCRVYTPGVFSRLVESFRVLLMRKNQ